MYDEPQNLATLIATEKLAVGEVLRIGREAALKLTTVHGDLTPSAIEVSLTNVTVVPEARGRFGQYAAPERILGKPATPQSDVYSLGAILFHALAGRPPFEGSSPAQVMLKACADAVPDLRALRDGVSDAIAKVIERCLHKDPNARYASCAVLAEALAEATKPQKVVVAAPPPPRKSGKRMLAADDDASIRELILHVAENVGVEADIVCTGRDAINAMKTCRYDIAVLDLNMPRLSGWEVLDFLRDHHNARPRHLFVFTGFANQTLAEGERAFVSRVLYKPMPMKELSAIVAECI